MNQHIWVGDLSVIEESPCWSNLRILRLRDSKDLLVELSPLVISYLAGLANGLADVPSSEVTHISALSPTLAVLVRE